MTPIPKNSLVVEAAKNVPTDTVPVWFMRQAGRSLPEYRAIRRSGSILETIKNPELSAEISLQPLRRYGVDAVILYSDIVVPAYAVGFGIEVVQGRGPVVSQPFRNEDDLKRLRPLEPEVDTEYVIKTVQILTQEIDVPLIGFAGAPFTVASYLIEGGPSKTYVHTKSLMRSNPKLFHQLMEKLSQLAISSLRSQIEAGASLYQLFDSWAGVLSPREYRAMVAPYSKAIFEALDSYNVPSIHFGVGTSNLLEIMADSGCSTLGVDDRIGLDQAYARTNGQVAIQGNLDPVNILIGTDTAIAESTRVLEESSICGGYIFNLGHGVLPESNPDTLAAVVDFVHQYGADIRRQTRNKTQDKWI